MTAFAITMAGPEGGERRVMSLFMIWHEKRPSGGSRPRPGLADLLSETHFQPQDARQGLVSTRDGDWHYYVAAIADAFLAPQEQSAIAPDSALFLNGYAYDPLSAQPRVHGARELLEASAPGRRAELAGEHAIAHIDASGQVTAHGGPEGLRHLYWLETDDLIAFSTRPSLLALLTGTRAPDLLAQTWISVMGYRVGTRSSLEGIAAVPQGRVALWTGRRLELRAADTPLARLAGPRGLDAVPEAADLLDAAATAAAGAVRLAARQGEAIDLAITGGKDSRVVLALCLAAGLKDRLRLFTRGEADHPDVIVGRMIAERLGLPHRRQPVAAPSSVPFLSTAEFFARVSSFAYQSDGLVGAWDIYVQDVTAASLAMTGMMGEVLKCNAKSDFDPALALQAPLELVRKLSPLDPLGMLRPEARERLQEDVGERLARHVEDGVPVEDLTDVFYYTNRIPNWLGTARQVEAFARTSVMPLGVPPLLKLAFTATAGERRTGLLHYRLLQRFAPQLLTLPFANAQWSPELAAKDPDFQAVAAVVAPEGSRTPAFGSWQYSVNYNVRLRRALMALVEDSGDAPIWSCLDRRAVLRRLSAGPLSFLPMISLLGLVPVILYQTDRITPHKMLTPGSSFAPAAVLRDREGRLWRWEQKRLQALRAEDTPVRLPRPIARAFLAAPADADCGAVEGYLDAVLGPLGPGVRAAGGHRIEVSGEGEVTFSGWARSKDFTQCPLAVEIAQDERILCRVVADGYRADLRKAGIGQGNHAFLARLPAGRLHELAGTVSPCELTVRIADAGMVLAGGIVRVVRSGEDAHLPGSRSLAVRIARAVGWRRGR